MIDRPTISCRIVFVERHIGGHIINEIVVKPESRPAHLQLQHIGQSQQGVANLFTR